MWSQNITINTRRHDAPAYEDGAVEKLDPARLITHRFTLDQNL
jgi:hypothetical protein